VKVTYLNHQNPNNVLIENPYTNSPNADAHKLIGAGSKSVSKSVPVYDG